MDPKQKLRPGALPQLLGYRLRLAQQAVFRDFAASVQGLSPGRVGVLIYIDANPGVTQSRLAEAAERDRSTMVGVLDQLEARGLIERRRSVEDERVVEVFLTGEGKRLRRRAVEIPRAMWCKTKLSLAELATLRAQLHELARELREA